MKNLFGRIAEIEKCRLIATFGRARLVVANRGQLELRGGSLGDQVAAREWISLFMHEAVPKVVAAR